MITQEDLTSAVLRNLQVGEKALVLERRGNRVRLQGGGWASIVATGGKVLLERLPSAEIVELHETLKSEKRDLIVTKRKARDQHTKVERDHILDRAASGMKVRFGSLTFCTLYCRVLTTSGSLLRS